MKEKETTRNIAMEIDVCTKTEQIGVLSLELRQKTAEIERLTQEVSTLNCRG